MMKYVTVVLCLLPFASSYNILGFFPVTYKSHYSFAKPLITELAKRGHNLTVYTVFADGAFSGKYREIDIKHCMVPPPAGTIDLNINGDSVFKLLKLFSKAIPNASRIVGCAPLTQLLNSTDHYDLLLTDILHTNWWAGFAYKFGVPMISVFPNILMTWFADSIGAITNPSYVANFYADASPRMNFWERLNNFYVYTTLKLFGPYYVFNPSNELAREVFGEDVPPLGEIVKNTSITFTNTYTPSHMAMPVPPNLVQVGRMHIKEAKVLPEVGKIILYDDFCLR